MDCKTFALLLDTPESEWTEQQRLEMERHAEACAACAREWTLRREMRAMDQETTVPAAFTASWQNTIREEATKKMNGKRIFSHWKRIVAAVAAVAVVGIGTAATYQSNFAGSKSAARQTAYEPTYEDGGASYGYEYAYDLDDMAAGSEKRAVSESAMYTTNTAADVSEREAKIVRTVNITLQTRQYQSDYDALRQLTGDCGGRIESLSTSGDGSAGSLRRANFTLRIPSDRLDDFIAGAKGIANVSSYNESSEDVSESYYDMQTRLETQRAKLQRLTEMMEKAEDVSDLIEIESAISAAQYWIDYYTGQMRGYDSRVSDSYVYITLRELSSAKAAETKKLSLLERIGSALEASLEMAGEAIQALVIFLVAALPWLLALAVVILVIRLIVRRIRKQRKAKKEENE